MSIRGLSNYNRFRPQYHQFLLRSILQLAPSLMSPIVIPNSKSLIYPFHLTVEDLTLGVSVRVVITIIELDKSIKYDFLC